MGAPPGNQFAARGARVRNALMERLTKDELHDIITALLEKARAGDMPAIQEIFNRIDGKPSQSIDIQGQLNTPALPGSAETGRKLAFLLAAAVNNELEDKEPDVIEGEVSKD